MAGHTGKSEITESRTSHSRLKNQESDLANGECYARIICFTTKVQFTIMLAQGTLWIYLAEVDEQATTMFFRLAEQMKTNEGITEQLKKKDNRIEWVVKINI